MKNRILLKLLILVTLITSCKKDEPTTPTDPTENYNPPTDNTKMVEEKFLSGYKFSSYYGAISSYDGNFIVYGVENNSNDGKNFIKKINANGVSLWSIDATMRIRQIQALSNNQFLAVGGLDNNADNSLENASMIVFDGNGNILDQKSKSDNNATIYFNGATKLASTGDTQNIYCHGGALKSSTYYPHAMNIKITSAGKIIFGTALDNTNAWKEGIDYNQPNKVYSDIIEVDNNTIAVLNNAILNNQQDDLFYIQKLNLKSSMTPVSEASHTGSINSDFIKQGSDLYLSGDILDQTTPVGTDGNKWKDGMVLKLNSSGTIVWKQTISIGSTNKKQDILYDLALYNGKVYAVGNGSGVYYETSKREFRNGLISVLDASNGSVISNMMMGDKTYSSTINTCVLSGSQLVNFGSTKYSVNGSTDFQGWFFKVNL